MILETVSSGISSIRERALFPPTISNALSISRTFTVIPGRLTVRLPQPYADSGIFPAINRLLMIVLVEQTQSLRLRGTDSTLFSPFRGSRIIPEQNDDAAPVGFSGRTMMVGSLTIRPSNKPLREKSFNRVSVMNFRAPYGDCGSVIVDSLMITSSDVCPNTAKLEGKMTRTPGLTLRRVSRMYRQINIDSKPEIQICLCRSRHDTMKELNVGKLRREQPFTGFPSSEVCCSSPNSAYSAAGLQLVRNPLVPPHQ